MKKIFSSSSTSNSSVDFDAEGRNLWARLNLDKSSVGGRQWNPIDPIWRNPNTNGTIYVGNQSAAENLRLLQSLGITHVVNCTAGQGSSQIPNYHEGKLKYYRFPISYWSSYVRPNDDESVSAFLSPVFAFIDEALVSGENILVHCLAGAHRAGTTGILCLMNYAELDPVSATRLAKTCRPVIDPIAHLPELLHRFHRIKLVEIEGRLLPARGGSADDNKLLKDDVGRNASIASRLPPARASEK